MDGKGSMYVIPNRLVNHLHNLLLLLSFRGLSSLVYCRHVQLLHSGLLSRDEGVPSWEHAVGVESFEFGLEVGPEDLEFTGSWICTNYSRLCF